MFGLFDRLQSGVAFNKQHLPSNQITSSSSLTVGFLVSFCLLTSSFPLHHSPVFSGLFFWGLVWAVFSVSSSAYCCAVRTCSVLPGAALLALAALVGFGVLMCYCAAFWTSLRLGTRCGPCVLRLSCPPVLWFRPQLLFRVRFSIPPTRVFRVFTSLSRFSPN